MAVFDEAFEVFISHEDDPGIPGKILRNDDGRIANLLSEVPEQFRPLAIQLTDETWYYAYTRTRYGVDERVYPNLRNGGFYSTMANSQALAVSKTIALETWSFDKVNDQTMATKIFDACMDQGRNQILPVLKRALGQVGAVMFSWHWGPSMQDAVNKADAEALQTAFTSCLTDYYNGLAKRQHLKVTPATWIARAEWMPS